MADTAEPSTPIEPADTDVEPTDTDGSTPTTDPGPFDASGNWVGQCALDTYSGCYPSRLDLLLEELDEVVSGSGGWTPLGAERTSILIDAATRDGSTISLAGTIALSDPAYPVAPVTFEGTIQWDELRGYLWVGAGESYCVLTRE